MTILAGYALAMTAMASNSDELTTILGSSADQWDIRRQTGPSDDHQLTTVDGRPVLAGGPNGVNLTSRHPLEPDTELTVRFRMGAAGGKATSFYFCGSLQTPTEASHGKPMFLVLQAPAAATQEVVTCQMPAWAGRLEALYQPYVVRYLPPDRSTWPAMIRQQVEDDYHAVPPLPQRWLTLRYVVRQDSAQLYLDGYLLRDISGPDFTPKGHFRLSLFEGAQLASVRVRSLPPEDPLFEMIPMEHQFNAISRRPPSFRAEPGEILRVDRVPFIVPGRNDAGHDHLNVARSWMRFGALEGGFDPWEGATARWRGMALCEAGRLMFRVRNGQYRALHLLAHFDAEEQYSVPIVTAQFYRTNAGHPLSFVGRARTGPPRRVTIPLEPEGLAALSDGNWLEFELTKAVRVHRSFPDPIYYSQHGAGLPSGVRVYAMTLERPAVEVHIEPDRYAHLWTAPEHPSYTVRLKNRTARDGTVTLTLRTQCRNGVETTTQTQPVRVAAHHETTVNFPLRLTRYGYHQVELHAADDAGVRTQTRSLAYLRPDTRERGNWEEGKGILFGFWDWRGAHLTPTGIARLQLAATLGIESSHKPLTAPYYTTEELEFAERHQMITHFRAYQLHMIKEHIGVEYDPTRPEEMQHAIVEAIEKGPFGKPTPTNKPELAVFWAEPLLGSVSYRSFPEYYGEPPYQMTEREQQLFEKYRDEFIVAGTAIKQRWPETKLLMPWGIPSFPIPFLRHSPEATALMDGPAVDLVLFERLPEMQMHQVTFASTMWQLKQEWLKAGKQWPKLISIEGVCPSPATPGAMTLQQEADHAVRAALFLAAYGVTRQLGWPSLARCAGAWGESHYGGGLTDPLPLLSPKPIVSAWATMTRQLNRMNYVKALDTGSATVFALQFQHYRTGELVHVFWTVRGRRTVHLELPQGVTVQAFDDMDNEIPVNPLEICPAPCYVRGLPRDAKFTLGPPDHSDSQPGNLARRVASLGDGTWTLSHERDGDYETAHLEFVVKFPGPLTARPVRSEKGQALAIHLGQPDKERKTMPFYASLVPRKPILLPGKPSHLGLWVRAASDWGRVVYCLRDAKGERWISIGKKNEWNVDDPHCWSAFNFDGWRYLQFELPGNQPWDCYRDAGSSFWGYYGEGDGIVDLPLQLEKIIVERRTHVIKLDQLIPADPSDVLLGDLFVEYETAADRTAESIRLSRLRMARPGDIDARRSPTGPALLPPEQNTPFK